MTLQDFIDTYRSEIDMVIHSHVSDLKIDDGEREMWIMNNESLYCWALDSGVEEI